MIEINHLQFNNINVKGKGAIVEAGISTSENL